MMQKICKMTETLANGYSYGSAQRELSNEYQHDGYKKSLRHCAWDESSLIIGRLKQPGSDTTYFLP